MTARPVEERPHVVFCSCAYYETIPQATRQQVFDALRNADVAVEAVTDLCGMAADRHPRLRHWVQAEPLSIVACYPRAVRWLFEAAGVPLNMERTRLLNMRTQSVEEILEAILVGPCPKGASDESMPGKDDGWVPWFPVVDYDRCKNCKQCMNFCLFGVYGLSAEGRLEVQNPAGCKTNCPACARMCSSSAIIFPKYADAPINGADTVPSPDSEEAPAPDLRRLLQGDLYDKIRRRSPGQKRFSIEQKESEPACPCPNIDALRRDLDIPDEVLASLSSEELRRIRGEAAKRDSQNQPSGEQSEKESRHA
jgi:NAD-dependent dihydropyrimidine dehydrogenase PreA subunit